MLSFGDGGLFVHRTLGTLILIIGTPVFVLMFWYACFAHNGSFLSLFEEFQRLGWYEFFLNAVPTPFDPVAWKIIMSYSFFELMLMKYVPGKEFRATATATDHVPIYIANGVQCYFISVITLLVGFYTGYIELDLVYDNMGKLLATSNILALALCVFLPIKGLYFPSTKDCGSSGSVIVDFFWGTELYPRIFGFDVKEFTNCRYGMMFWQLGLLCYAAKQYSMLGYVSSSMLSSVLVQSVYICKFFVWETGYFCSMDIQHDRAGYYLCWGCMMWLPCIYTIHTYFMVNHPVMLSVPTFLFITGGGLFCIWWNYNCDEQRQVFRGPGGTKIKIWGNEPEYITATYTTKEDDKKVRTSLLLLSGWWGLARHFHYLPEIGAAFFWCLPALFDDGPLPYFYPFYLTILLVDRAWRDDKRCGEKYGKYWQEYCDRVPYKIVPGVV